MTTIFWTGKLTPQTKFLADFSNAIAWLTGNARDAAAMKARIKRGYEGTVTNDVTRYDELGLQHFTETSNALLEGINLQGKIVLDVGCGTGILSLLALERGCTKVVCGDLSEYMLSQCRKKANVLGYGPDRINFRQIDAESLPFESNTFDAVISGMVLGLIPDQQNAITEMVRVLKPGGTLSVSAHGTELYHEACEATIQTMAKNLVIGYRVEFWPRQEKDIARMFSTSGLTDVSTRRLVWKKQFADGGKAYDFFASTSSAWWYSKFTPDKGARISQKLRSAFERKPVREITLDVILAHGRKP
jgi:ubiquinone/menaquinone biosynthesis C-methylase UbiE